MKRLYPIIAILFLTLILVLTPKMTTRAAGGTPEATINVNIVATFDGENPDVPLIEGKQVYGAELTVNLGSHPGYEFAFLVVDGVVKHDIEITENEFQVIVSNNLEVVSVFHPINKYAVVFVDYNGKLIETQYEDYEFPSNLPTKIGFAHNGWEVVVGSNDLANITENTVCRLKYVRTETNSVIINDVEYGYNDIVTLEATLEDFTHWEEDGKVVSYDPNYTFSALYDRELVEKNTGTEQPLVTISHDLQLRENAQSYLGQVYVPEGYELVEQGFLTSINKGVLTIDNATLYKGTLHPTTKEFLITFNNSHEYVEYRAYAVLKHGIEFVTVYSYNDYDLDLVIQMPLLGNTSIEIDEDDIKTILSNEYLNKVTQATKVFGGNSSSGLFQGTGFFKFGTSDVNGQLNLEFKSNVLIKTVVIYGTSWMASDNDKIKINGIEKNIKTDKITRFVFDLNNLTNIIKIETIKRAFIFSIEFYGPDAVVPEEYTATLDYDNGQPNNIIKTLGNTKLLEPLQPQKVGYNFVGWFNGDTEWDFDEDVVVNNLTLKAHWNIKQYTISFNSLGGSAVSSITQNYGTVVSQPSNPSREGYEFVEWQLNGEKYIFSTIPAANIALNAKWIEENVNKYEVIFDLNYDSAPTVESQLVTEGEYAVKPNIPEREGYIFDCWKYDGNTFDFDIPLHNDITLVAEWFAVIETIFYQTGFESDDGFVATTNYNQPEKTHGSEDYKWGIYYGSPTTTSSSLISGSQTIIMRWYNNAPTNLSYMVSKFPVELGSKVTFKAKNTSAGFNVVVSISLNGKDWFDAQTFVLTTDVTDYTYKIKENSPVYIKFSMVPGSADKKDILIDDLKIYVFVHSDIEKYNITFDLDYTGAPDSLVEQVLEGFTVNKPSNPTREGYTFKGWYLEESEFDFNTSIGSNLILVAKWEIIEESEFENLVYDLDFTKDPDTTGLNNSYLKRFGIKVYDNVSGKTVSVDFSNGSKQSLGGNDSNRIFFAGQTKASTGFDDTKDGITNGIDNSGGIRLNVEAYNYSKIEFNFYYDNRTSNQNPPNNINYMKVQYWDATKNEWIDALDFTAMKNTIVQGTSNTFSLVFDVSINTTAFRILVNTSSKSNNGQIIQPNSLKIYKYS